MRSASRIAADDLRIRRAEPTDYAAVRDIMASRATYANTLQLPFPSLEQWRERMARSDGTDCAIVAEARQAGQAGQAGQASQAGQAGPAGEAGEAFTVVGHLVLDMAKQQRRSHVCALGMSVRHDWQGRGVGTVLLAAAIDRADNWMNVLRIELTVFVDNEAACALYRRHGFVIEGRHRAHAMRDGAFVDAFTMARLHPRPARLPATVEG